ncbi:hypothetical protein RKACHI23_00110 [Rhodoluna lacicola]|nr:hypothetical protein RKACHI23_00110 [Rhodoluna lacicola]
MTVSNIKEEKIEVEIGSRNADSAEQEPALESDFQNRPHSL